MSATAATDNVVVLVIDALRADRVGAYGSEQGLTPTLDTLAEMDGTTTFDNAFACINTTDPSITSLHTGRYPRSTVMHHGGLITDAEKRRIEAVPYVPERLSAAGVRTLAAGRVMGRWHDRGFDEYAWDSVEATEMKVSEALQSIHPLLHRVIAGCYNRTVGQFRDGDGLDDTGAVEDVLRTVARDTGPFYGFVHLMDTHAWYDADPELVDELLAANDYPDGDLQAFFDEYSDSPIVSKLLEPNATPADYDAGLSRLFARYDATVREADRKLERLIDGLKSRGEWETTALLVLSDHGESLHEHGIYFDHHGLYEPTVRVPLIARVPGSDGGRIDDFVQIHDLAPTILDLFGADPIDDADGRSLLGYLDADIDPPATREQVFIEEAHAQRRRAVRTKRYKFIEHVPDDRVSEFWETDSFRCGYCDREHGSRTELYDLRSDPEETENLADEREDLVERFRDSLNEFGRTHTPVETGDERITYDDEEEVMERLEDLGYR